VIRSEPYIEHWATAEELARSMGTVLGADVVEYSEQVFDGYVAAGALRKRVRSDGRAEYCNYPPEFHPFPYRGGFVRADMRPSKIGDQYVQYEDYQPTWLFIPDDWRADIDLPPLRDYTVRVTTEDGDVLFER